MISVLWQSGELRATEYCELSATAGGHRLTGMVVLPILGLPGHIRYRVEVDGAWFTQECELAITGGGRERRLLLVVDDQGTWRLDGDEAPGLEGCLDIDLGFSPSTNTLPIRRLALDEGASAAVSAAWVRFPQLVVERLDQVYERLSERRYRYRAGTFEAELGVDAAGLVTDYAEWTAVARFER